MTSRRSLSRALAALAAGALLFAACSGGSNDGDSNAAETGARVARDVDRMEEGGAARGSDAPYAVTQRAAALSDDAVAAGPAPDLGAPIGGGAASEIPPIGPTVIKTADVRLEVTKGDLDDTLDEATTIAARSGGFVVTSSVSDDETGRAQIVIRVPADRFELALADVRALGQVDSETVSGQDVGQEFVDLEARLRNASAQEAVLLRLMDRAQTVAATIRVQRELANVQLEIERLKGRLRYLEDQATLSTIAISFVEEGAPVEKDEGPLQRALKTAVDTFTSVVSGVIVGAGFVIPVALLMAVAYVALAPLVRRLRPRWEQP